MSEARVVSYRLATPEEEHTFFRRLFDITRRPEFEQAGLSGEALDTMIESQYHARTTHYKEAYPEAEYRMIFSDADLAGGMIVEERDGDLHLIDITLLDERRGQGIGTRVMSDLIEDAKRGGRGVLLFVEQFNPAQRLYERLGFVEVELVGIYRRMVWKDPCTHRTESDKGM